jgi:hypothetical protein
MRIPALVRSVSAEQQQQLRQHAATLGLESLLD